MIPFLVKLATILDEKGQYKLAKEIDDLLVKIADGPVETQEGLVSAGYEKLLDALSQVNAQLEALEADPRSGRLATQARESIEILMGKIGQNPTPNEKQAWGKNVADWMDGWARTMRNEELLDKPAFIGAWNKLLGAAKPFYQPVQQDRASKMPVSTRHSNSLVAQIQNLLGVKQDGVWGPATNSAFLAEMKKSFPDMIPGGKFAGDLKAALDLVSRSVKNRSSADLMNKHMDAQEAKERAAKQLANQSGNKALTPYYASEPANPATQKGDNEVPPKGSPNSLGGPGRYQK